MGLCFALSVFSPEATDFLCYEGGRIMATETRNDKLLKFYDECEKNGYIDMRDKTQSLKAKVIATDLGLSYSKIGTLYEEAKKAFDGQKQLESQSGTMVFSCYSSSLRYEKESPIIELYRYGDRSYYCIVEGKRVNGAPTVYTATAVLPKTYYREPSTTYYGVSYNGMTTGSVSHDPGGATTRMESTDRGYIVFKIGEDRYTVQAIKPSVQMAEAFKRDEVFRQFYNGKILVLDSLTMVTSSRSSIYDAMRETYLSLDECRKAEELIRRMANNQLPPSDQELYDKAVGLLSATSSDQVKKAISIFELISDFKDAPQQKEKAEKRLEEVVQSEKENAIIQKGNNKKLLIVVAILAVIVVNVIAYFARQNAINNLEYVNDRIHWNYSNSTISDREHDNVYVHIETDENRLHYEKIHDSKYGSNYTVEDKEYTYSITVNYFGNYVIKAGTHKLRLGDLSSSYYNSLTEGFTTLTHKK